MSTVVTQFITQRHECTLQLTSLFLLDQESKDIRVRWTFLHLDLHWAPSTLLLKYSLSHTPANQSYFFSPTEHHTTSSSSLWQNIVEISAETRSPWMQIFCQLFITTLLLDLTVGLDKTSQFILQIGKIGTVMKFTELLCWLFLPKTLLACGENIFVTYCVRFIPWMLTIPV